MAGGSWRAAWCRASRRRRADPTLVRLLCGEPAMARSERGLRVVKPLVVPAFAGIHGNGSPFSAHPRASGEPGLNMGFYVYILARRRNGTLYMGHTADLSRP